MTKIETIRPQQFINPDMQRLFEGTEEFADQFVAPDFLQGVKLENIAITTGGNQYAHGLNNSYVGFFVLNRDSTAVVYTEPSLDDSKFIKLKSTSNINTTIWVF